MRAGQRGVGTVVAMGSCLVLGTVALGAATLGIVVTAKIDARRMADTAALTAIELLRTQGLPFDATKQSIAEKLANQQSKYDAQYDWKIIEATDGSTVTVQTGVKLSVKGLPAVIPIGPVIVGATASGRVRQEKTTKVKRFKPALGLVLDYTGSMNRPVGSGSLPIEVLRGAVENLVDDVTDIDYGLVLFNEQALAPSITASEGTNAAIKARLGTNAQLQTCSSCGLAEAMEIFPSEDHGRYVLFVTDGAPNRRIGEANPGDRMYCPVGGNPQDSPKAETEARQKAALLRGMDATIYTLHISWRYPGCTEDKALYDARRKFLTDISGKSDSSDDDRANVYYSEVSAADADGLRDKFKKFVGSIS